MLEPHRDIEVVAEASDAASAQKMCCSSRPDVALVDLRLGCDSGLDVLRILSEHCPSCRPVMLTAYVTEQDVSTALDRGARGYVLKYADPAEIAGAVRAAHDGRRYFSPHVTATMAEGKTLTRLTDREQQVLELLVPGHRNRVIGRTLGIAEETVKAHVKRILVKMGARDRTEAVTKAIQRGLVRVD